ncbi:MAG: biotin--[acetyl-CoA-carboxylase] ligase [Candidatus Aegiribacteria sp.]
MSESASRILGILRERGGYISGQDMSRELGISRTAVWKNVEKLRETGYTIDAVSNRGYRLVQSVDLPTSDEIGRYLGESSLNPKVVYMKTVDSTNSLAMMLAAQGAVHGTVVTADMQTSGKGRKGREWHSPPGSNLYLSMILRPSVPPAEASQIPVLTVIASIRALRRLVPDLTCSVKWPNDIYCGGRKISGTLCEMKAEMDSVEHVVVGTGINVNTDPSEINMPETATSLFMETGRRYCRAELAARLLEDFQSAYDVWIAEGSLRPFIPEWKSCSLLLGSQVDVRTATKIVTGRAMGIAENGALKLQLRDGTRRLIYAGDATLHGEYGPHRPKRF